MTASPAFTVPSEDAASTLPFDAKTWQNLVNAITQNVMHRAPIALTVTGTTALTATCTPPLPEYRTGNWFWWIAPAACAGPTSLDVSGLGAKNIRDRASAVLAPGAWAAGDLVAAVYEGTYLRLIGSFDFAAALASNGMPPGYVVGMVMSTNAGDPNNDVDFTTGYARSQDNSRDIIQTAALTKRMDAVWAQGTNQGCILQSANLTGTITVTAGSAAFSGSGTAFLTDLIVGDVVQTAGGQARRIATLTSDTAGTFESAMTSTETGVTYKRGGKARNCCYRLFAIRRDSDGGADYAASTRDTPVDLPAGWSSYALVDYAPVDAAGNNLPFTRVDNRIYLTSAIQSQATTGATFGSETHSKTTLLPPNVVALMQIEGVPSGTAAETSVTVFPTALSAPAGRTHLRGGPASLPGLALFTETEIPLDANSSYKTKTYGAGADYFTYYVYLLGWIDPRGGGGGVSANPHAGRVGWTATLTPAALSGDTNDWSPSGLASTSYVEIDYGADGRLLTGLLPGTDGDFIDLYNAGSTYGILKNQSASSTAAYRFGFAADVYHWPGQIVRLRYDGAAARWRAYRAEATQAEFDNSAKLATTAYVDRAARHIPHIVAQPDPFPTVPFKPTVWANWAAMPWLDEQFTFTRSAAALYLDRAGVLRTAAVDEPRFHTIYSSGQSGLLIEGGRTNVVLWNRDLTNAAWTKTNVTAAKDQTGPDGVANSASKLTATASDATCLQAITLSSSARAQAVWLKRLTGSGAVSLTMDGGSTWTAVALTTLWKRLEIPTQTLANPSVGVKLATSGDAIAIDYFQNETGTFSSSEIATTTAQVTRGSDVCKRLNGDGVISLVESSLFAEFCMPVPPSTGNYALDLSDMTYANQMNVHIGTSNQATGRVTLSGSATSLTGAVIGTGVLRKQALAFAAGDFAFTANGAAVLTAAAPAAHPAVTAFKIGGLGGGGGEIFGVIQKIAYWPRRITNANLQTVTT